MEFVPWDSLITEIAPEPAALAPIHFQTASLPQSAGECASSFDRVIEQGQLRKTHDYDLRRICLKSHSFPLGD